jgi:coenzyme F420 hydrogenase subunit beta
MRALTSATGAPAPLLISFFCAGTPSQRATDQLVEHLGVPVGKPLRDLWYRGRGWPGRFTAVATDGSSVSTDYDDSWGTHLGPTAQWRCKLCPDGVGESADIVAADYWNTDARGYPLFTESDGVSALIARTARGLDVIQRAIAAGVLVVAPLDIERLAAVQPLQHRRRQQLFARLLGTRLAGRRVPRYRGFGLALLTLRHPLDGLRTARGALRRARAGRSR